MLGNSRRDRWWVYERGNANEGDWVKAYPILSHIPFSYYCCLQMKINSSHSRNRRWHLTAEKNYLAPSYLQGTPSPQHFTQAHPRCYIWRDFVFTGLDNPPQSISGLGFNFIPLAPPPPPMPGQNIGFSVGLADTLGYSKNIASRRIVRGRRNGSNIWQALRLYKLL